MSSYTRLSLRTANGLARAALRYFAGKA